MEPIIKLTDEDYWRLSNRGAGLCRSCGDLDDSGCVEPDARHYRCEACDEREVFGLEEAMVMGLVEVTE
jgi:hypothetical protein